MTHGRITVDTTVTVCRASELLIGANLEDLNYQLTGGIDSQLVYGESLEDPVRSAWTTRGPTAGASASTPAETTTGSCF